MIAELILLGPAGMSILFAGVFQRPQEWWARVLLYVGAIAAGVALFVLIDAGEDWRTVSLGTATAIVGAGIASAFVVSVALHLRTDRWHVVSLLGIASSGIAVAVGNAWLVPGILFWECSSLALATIARDAREPSSAWFSIFLSDALLLVGVVASALEDDSWRMPGHLDGWHFYAVLVALVVRSGALPAFGAWRLVDSPAAAATPLLVAGTFAAGTRFVFGDAPLEAAVVIVIGLGLAAWGLFPRTPLGVTAAWPVLLALGLSLTSADAALAAGVAGTLAAGAVALWPNNVGAGAARGFLISFVPPGPGFWAVVIAAMHAFDRAVLAEDVIEEVRWVLIAGLLPFGVAASVALGVRSARVEFGEGARSTRLATWFLAFVALAATLWPSATLQVDDAVIAEPLRVALLQGIAVVVAVAAAWLARRGSTQAPVPPPAPAYLRMLPRRISLGLVWAALLCALASIATAVWITFEGLSVGFL